MGQQIAYLGFSRRVSAFLTKAINLQMNENIGWKVAARHEHFKSAIILRIQTFYKLSKTPKEFL